MNVKNQYVTDNYSIYNGDSCEVLRGIPDNSIGYSIFSPPFISLFTYSNSDRDLGNTKNESEFYEQFKYIAEELYRVIEPGRLMSVHCMDLPATQTHDGFIGLKDFPGELTRLFTEIGFIYHSKVCIWKDPLLQATRTHTLGLLHKQIVKDSSMCQQGLPDYLITFRKPGENMKPIAHPDGLTQFFGEDEPAKGVYSHQVWRKYASPVWMDIRQSYTLNGAVAREEKDEKHVCPLQLDTIARGIELWSNPGDIVLTPFMGIGSECYQSLKMGRKAVGVELKTSYFEAAHNNLEKALQESKSDQITFEDLG